MQQPDDDQPRTWSDWAVRALWVYAAVVGLAGIVLLALLRRQVLP